jgi:hypothetical protein
MVIRQKSWIFPILAVLAALIGTRFMFKAGFYYNMQDDMQLIRQIEFESCLKDGQIPCRWTPRLGYGYGYPEFNFYPPFPYIVGQIIRTFKFSYLETVKYGAIAQFIAAALAMYLLGSSIFGPLGGLITSVFFTFAPYHALNIYVRGAYNEAWASVFFPLIFYFSRLLILKYHPKNLILLSLSICGLLLSHNPMAMLFFPAVFLWCLYWILTTSQKKYLLLSLFRLSLSAVIGLLLSAFFTLPLLFETKYVQVETMFKNYFDFRAHFVNIRQLFISNFWSDGPSVWQEADGMSFMVGYLHWIIPLLIVLFFGYLIIKRQKLPKLLLLCTGMTIFSLFYIFLTHEKSTFIWLILKPIQKIQFPWRFLNPALFLLSLSVGILPRLFPQKIKYIIIPLLISVLIINFSHFYPVTYGRLSEKDKFSGQSWTNQITSGIYDYLPKTAGRAAQKAATEYIDGVEPSTSSYTLSGQRHGTNWLFFNISLNSQPQIIISQLYFPGFKIFDYGKEIPFTVEPEFGRMVVVLSPGQHQLYVKLFNTPVRTFSNIISLIAWLIVITYLFFLKWKYLRLKN